MKKIFYILLTVAMSFILSSYTAQQLDLHANSRGAFEKKISKGDSIFVKTSTSVNINVPKYQKEDKNLIIEQNKALNNLIVLQQEKNKLSKVALEAMASKYEQLCENLNTTPDELYKKARADTIIRFFVTLLLITFIAIGIRIIWGLSGINTTSWQNLSILAIVFLLILSNAYQYLYYVFSYIFNHDYLIIKELINQIK